MIDLRYRLHLTFEAFTGRRVSGRGVAPPSDEAIRVSKVNVLCQVRREVGILEPAW